MHRTLLPHFLGIPCILVAAALWWGAAYATAINARKELALEIQNGLNPYGIKVSTEVTRAALLAHTERVCSTHYSGAPRDEVRDPLLAAAAYDATMMILRATPGLRGVSPQLYGLAIEVNVENFSPNPQALGERLIDAAMTPSLDCGEHTIGRNGDPAAWAACALPRIALLDLAEAIQAPDTSPFLYLRRAYLRLVNPNVDATSELVDEDLAAALAADPAGELDVLRYRLEAGLASLRGDLQGTQAAIDRAGPASENENKFFIRELAGEEQPK